MNCRWLYGALAALGAAAPLLAAAEPDQVLVLYNQDWTEDLPGTEPGQDSEEVARYYVARHTDPRTGRRPYLLGLSCRHKAAAGSAGHLSAEYLEEKSADNFFALAYRGKGPAPSSADLKAGRLCLISTHVECVLDVDAYEWSSLELKIGESADEAKARPVFAAGKSLLGEGLLLVREGETQAAGRTERTRTLLLDARRAGFAGDVHAWLSAKGRQGADLQEKARFFDPADLEFSRTGPDGVRDDLHYLQDVEQPVKAFLEDPQNAADGRPLKDRILYVVLCYGLPRTVTRLYGMGQTAVPGSWADAGNLVSLEQRLELAYYDVEAVRPPRLFPVRFRQKAGALQAWAAVSSYWTPLAGPREHPFRHPAAYQDFDRQPHLRPPWPAPPPFTAERRGRVAKQFLLVCARIDADDPAAAKHLVDAAEYATQYLTPRIGSSPEGEWDGAKALAETDALCGAEELQKLGFPGSGPSINYAAYFGRRPAGGYFPGAVDWYVVSANGLNSRTSQVRQMLRDGVTVTGGAARAYRGCPHTTTHAWWDSRVFYHHLLRGCDLGEAWLLARYKLGWATSFVGDPLYRPDLRRTRFDRTPPHVAGADDVTIETAPAADRCFAVLRARLHAAPDDPELAAARAEYRRKGEETPDRAAEDPWYRKRPCLVLRDLDPESTYTCRLVLTDPYGNVFDSRERFGELTFRTGPAAPPLEPVYRRKDPTTVWIGGRGRKNMIGGDRGEIELVFEAAAAASYDILRCGDLALRQSGDTVTFDPGGGVLGTAAYRFEPGRAYRLRLRYRDWPVTREVWLTAKDGREFLLLADNRTPWRTMDLAAEMTCAQSARTGLVRSIALYADSRPGSEDGCRADGKFDADAFDRADGRAAEPGAGAPDAGTPGA